MLVALRCVDPDAIKRPKMGYTTRRSRGAAVEVLAVAGAVEDLRAGAGAVELLADLAVVNVLLGNHSYSVNDTLQQGQVLEYWDELLSASWKFRLAFFYSGYIPDGGYQLGIWYDGLLPHNPIWIANRNNPIIGESGNLSIDTSDGNLKIFQSGGNPIPVSLVKGARNTSATLLSSGNLVLQEMNSDGSVKRVLWQSFDYPTDTLLPGMKLGFNLQTGHQWFLRSWLTVGNPAQGSFTLVMDPNVTNKLNVMWFGEVHCSVVFLKGSFFFYSFNTIGIVKIYDFTYISNEQEEYFNYSLLRSFPTSTAYPSLTLAVDGSLLDDDLSPVACQISEILENQKNLTCRRSVSLNFPSKYGFMSGERTNFKGSDNMTFYDCQIICWNNCSCVAFSIRNETTRTGCEIWSREAKFIESETSPKETEDSLDWTNHCSSIDSPDVLLVLSNLEKIQCQRGEVVADIDHRGRCISGDTSVLLLML
ncbi:hypothetical protein EZV62_004009 [Acer yangbiense]|uniref:Bulb-type lectin domain-containing protein n=1 Tax=Acer yangbiense TaxID=1000413 RepID=A0A5C7IJI1_9ROSI|nr:hypothetical protein EZV62_004009 [Acer yangbiense]